MRAFYLDKELVGKICKITMLGCQLEKEYEEMFGIGDYRRACFCHWRHQPGKYQMLFMFIDQKPVKKHGLTWYCVKEIGNGVMGDWHWYTLDQLIICD